MLPLQLLALSSASSRAALASAASRHAPITMGGLTGLPRIPSAALQVTRKYNPGCEYTEPIATLYRDLETLYGNEDVAGLGGSRTYRDSGRLVDSGQKTNKFRGFTRDVDVRQQTVLGALRREPSLLNPQVSNRFEFARSKAILVSTLGSQQAAIEVMKQDPSILQRPDAIEQMSAAQIKARGLTKQLASTVGPLVLVGGAAGWAVVSGQVELPPELAAALPLSLLM